MRFADNVGNNKGESKALVSPPPQPAESLFERLYAELAALPLPLQEAVTPAQLRTMTTGLEGKESERVQIEAAVTLCEMRRSGEVGAENGGGCSEPVEKGKKISRSPKEMREVRTSRDLSPEGNKAKKPRKVILHYTRPNKGGTETNEASPEKDSPKKGSPEKDSPEKDIPIKPNPRKALIKANPRKAVPKIVRTKVTPIQDKSRRVTLHCTAPMGGLSEPGKVRMKNASPSRGQAFLVERDKKFWACLAAWENARSGV